MRAPTLHSKLIDERGISDMDNAHIPQDPCGNFRWYIENTKPEELPSFVRGRLFDHTNACVACWVWLALEFKKLGIVEPPENRNMIAPSVPVERLRYQARHGN